MKRFNLILAAAAITVFAACEKENKFSSSVSGEGQDATADTPYHGASTVLTPEQQKENLTATAEALIDQADINYWRSDVEWGFDTAKSISNFNGKADSELDEWADALEKAMNERTTLGNWNLYKTTIDLSQIKGHFTESNGVFHREDSDGLSADITLNGEAIHAEFTATLSNTLALIYKNQRTNNYRDEYWAYLPTAAKLTLSRGGKEIVTFSTTFSISMANPSQGLNPATDNLSVTLSIAAAGYELSISQAVYTPTSAKEAIAFKRGEKVLLAVASEAVYRMTSSQPDQLEDVNPQSLAVSVNLMGMTQIKGSVASYDTLMAAVRSVQASETEAALNANLAYLNTCYDLGVYYEGGSLKQASVSLEYVMNQYGYGSLIPVIRFADGSAIAAEQFFDEDSFTSLIQKAQSWLQKAERFFGSLN